MELAASSVAVRRSRSRAPALYRERSLIASTLQRSLLPPELPDIPGFRLAGAYRPAGEQNDVGGDFYDAFAVPGGWMVLVGDVAGRGAEAAALTSLSRYTLRTAGKLLGDPIVAFEQLNDALREREGLSLVSVCCVLLRSEGGQARADVVLAGHPPAFRVASGTPSPVGVFAPVPGRLRVRGLGGGLDRIDGRRPAGPLHRRRHRHGWRGGAIRRGSAGRDRCATARAPRTPWRGSSGR